MILKKNAAYLQGALDGDVKAAYEQILKKEGMDAVMKLNVMTNVQPHFSRKGLQAAYVELFRHCDFKNVVKLKNLTGVEPKIDVEMKEAVEEAYWGCFSGYRMVPSPNIENEMIKLTRKMKKFSGIEPSEKLLKEFKIDTKKWGFQ